MTEKEPLHPSNRLEEGKIYGATGGPQTPLVPPGKHDVKTSSLAAALEIAQNHQTTVYRPEELVSWLVVLSHFGKSVLAHQRLWTSLLWTVGAAVISAGLLISAVPSARLMTPSSFESMHTFLKVFIAFMLGLYIARCFQRWWGLVLAFKDYLISVKNMLFLLQSLNIKRDVIDTVERYCMAACYMLNTDLKNIEDKGTTALTATLDWLVKENFLEQQERDDIVAIRGMLDPKLDATCPELTIMWTWISEVISRMRLDPTIMGGQPMPPPMNLRVLNLCTSCISKIEFLKVNIIVQVPFIYTHLLSYLVHLNNFLLALCCGLTFGSAFLQFLQQEKKLQEAGSSSKELLGQIYHSALTMGTQLVVICVEPVLYTAFLFIGHMLCSPFGDQRHHLPTEVFIARLYVDLIWMTKSREVYRDHHASRSSEPQNEKGNNFHEDDAEDGEDDAEDGDDDA